MLNLNYSGENTIHKVDFDIVSEHIVKIVGSLPAKTKGFTLSREEEEDGWDYLGFTTIYQQGDGEILFSDDGSVYIKPKPAVQFLVEEGGSLSGEVRQEAERFEQLIPPTVEVEENYSFAGWRPELPKEGEIERDMTFVASIRYGPTLEEVQEEKVVEMNAMQQTVIHQGVDVELSDGSIEHFTLTDQDQASLMALQSQVAQGAEYVPWHNADQANQCKYYQNADMARIVQAALSFEVYQVTYFRDLRIYIRSLQTKEEVAAITYGMPIPEAYQSQVLKDMLAQMEGGA